jgi:hypothetical protein
LKIFKLAFGIVFAFKILFLGVIFNAHIHL